jgi:3-oxoacyl-[acyl-carrier protein] reductase
MYGGKKMFDLSGKVVIVTGGASGIGMCTARHMAELGASVAVFDRQEASKESGECENSVFFRTDVTLEGEVERNVALVAEKWGRIDALVCSAGVTYPYKTVVESDLAGWERTVNINSRGVFFCNRAVFPVMEKQRSGSIVNIASVAGKTGGGLLGNAIYGASKAAVMSFSKGLAREGGPFGITVNVICPGVVDTPMSQGLTQESRKSLIAATPLGKFAEPVDIMNTIVFLCSDAARHITSACLNVDGGFMHGN